MRASDRRHWRGNLPDRSKSPQFSDVIVRRSGGLPPILNFRNVFICFTQLPGKLTETVRWTAFRRAGYGSTLVQIDRHAIPFPRAGDSTPGSGRRLFSLFLLVITQVIQRICHLVHRVLTLFTTIGKIVTEFPGRIKENFTKEIEVCLRR